MANTLRLSSDPIGLQTAADLLRDGQTVAFPTETVYGLGARADDAMAVAGIYAAKERPSFNPLIVHVADVSAAQALCRWDDRADALAKAFWPGPLTLVLPRRPEAALAALAALAPGVTAGLSSVAVRCPAHPIAQSILTRVDAPLAAPSANPSGRLSPTTADHVLDGLSGRIAAVVDGGACLVGLESTIVDLTGPAQLLRAGSITPDQIAAQIGSVAQPQIREDQSPSAPGQLSSHYAPKAQLRLNASRAEMGETWLGFGNPQDEWSLSRSGDLAEAAANLFETLHAMDKAQVGAIAVAQIPMDGLGLAINDRLARAAAPRD